MLKPICSTNRKAPRSWYHTSFTNTFVRLLLIMPWESQVILRQKTLPDNVGELECPLPIFVLVLALDSRVVTAQ